MKKRILSLLLVFVLLCGTCSIVSVNAYSATDIAYPVEGGNIYFDKQDGSITDCDVSVTKADIPAEIEGTAVKNIRGASFYGCKKLESVTLPEGLLRIWGSAFYGCSALTTVSIPRTVVYIDSAAFQSCSAMTAIRVDKDNSFYCNDEYGVLFNKKKSTLIYMPDTYAGDYSIPDSVETIESKAFFGCAKLTKVTIPASVTTIKTEIGGWPFYYCRSLQEICVDAANQNYSSDACGFLFNKQKTELICMPGGFCGDYAIPESVTSISKNAFAFRSGLTGITIPAGITQIDVATFSACNALKSVTLPEGLTSIGFGAFQGCRSLTSITIPASVTKLDEKAFHDCMALTSVYFMGDAPEIGWGVFQTCDGTHKNGSMSIVGVETKRNNCKSCRREISGTIFMYGRRGFYF